MLIFARIFAAVLAIAPVMVFLNGMYQNRFVFEWPMLAAGTIIYLLAVIASRLPAPFKASGRGESRNWKPDEQVERWKNN